MKVLVLLRCSLLLVLSQAFNQKIFSRSASGLQLSNAPATQEDELTRMLSEMTRFFGFMVDESSQRFYYECRQGERLHQVHPIRDLAAAWDATKALQFWKHSASTNNNELIMLEKAVMGTLQSYSTSPIPSGKDGLMISGLPETPNIAHSALMILATVNAQRLSLLGPSDNLIVSNMDGLTKGILALQQDNGAFQTEFGNPDSVYQGIDFYPGEAMLALIEVHQLARDMPGILDPSIHDAILPSLQRALEFYSNYYRQANPDTNYNIWQVQAFAKLHDVTGGSDSSTTYIVDMCQDIVASKAWKYELTRGRSFFPNLQTVEIACGLDALVDGIQVAAAEDQPSVALFRRQAQNAVDFLEWSLDQVPAEVGGGLGYGGTYVREQRLDVTGHAISALAKWNQLR